MAANNGQGTIYAATFEVNGTAAGAVDVVATATTTGTRTQTLQDATGTIALLSGTQTWTGTQDFTGATVEVKDGASFQVKNTSDATKIAEFSCASITTGTTRTYTFQNSSGTLAMLEATQSFTAVNTFSNSTASISTTTGAVVVTGGVGIGGAISIGGNLQIFKGVNEALLRIAGGSNDLLQYGPATAMSKAQFGMGAANNSLGSYIETVSTGVINFYANATNTVSASFDASGNFSVVAAANANTANSAANAGNFPVWVKTTIPYTSFSTAGTTNSITLLSLVAAGVIHGVKIKHSTAFAGTGITAMTASVGVSGTLNKYASAFDVFSAVSNTNFQLSNVVGSENNGAATTILITGTSTGGNLNALTQGSVDVWVLMSKAV